MIRIIVYIQSGCVRVFRIFLPTREKKSIASSAGVHNY